MEEDVEDVSNGSAEVWDESLESPFWDILCKCFWNVTLDLFWVWYMLRGSIYVTQHFKYELRKLLISLILHDMYYDRDEKNLPQKTGLYSDRGLRISF